MQLVFALCAPCSRYGFEHHVRARTRASRRRRREGGIERTIVRAGVRFVEVDDRAHLVAAPRALDLGGSIGAEVRLRRVGPEHRDPHPIAKLLRHDVERDETGAHSRAELHRIDALGTRAGGPVRIPPDLGRQSLRERGCRGVLNREGQGVRHPARLDDGGVGGNSSPTHGAKLVSLGGGADPSGTCSRQRSIAS